MIILGDRGGGDAIVLTRLPDMRGRTHFHLIHVIITICTKKP